MKTLIARLLSAVVWIVNLLIALLTLCSAYSESLSPVTHPDLSCLGLAFPLFAMAEIALLVLLLAFRQYRKALLPFLVFVLCFSQLRAYCPINLFRAGAVGDTLTVLSYNVMSLPDDKDEEGTNRILSYLRDSGADVICLQEYNLSNSPSRLRQRDVEHVLGGLYPYRSVTAVGRSKSNHVACFSRFPILSERSIGGQGSYNGSAVYEIGYGADTITVVNNHLESNKLTEEDKAMYKDMLTDPEKQKMETGLRALFGKLGEASAIRSVQVDSLVALIDESSSRRLIVCGDFNDSPISYAYHSVARRLDDAFTRVGNGPGISYHRVGFLFRIDHIFADSRFRPIDCRVDRSIDVSDHYPVRATFVSE